MHKTREQYNEYMRVYMLARYHRRRQEAIVRLGGLCVDCGTTEQLEFDHADATDKSFNIAKIWSYSDGRYETELAKCVLRCTHCHLQKSLQSGDIRTVEHGGGVSGKKNCRCEPCKARKREYMRNYHKQASDTGDA